MSIKITPEQVKTYKKVGHSDGGSLFHVLLKGGYNIIVHKKDGKSEIVGAAPHRALAKFLALKKQKDFVFDELSKSEDVAIYQHLVPKYEELTAKLNEGFQKCQS